MAKLQPMIFSSLKNYSKLQFFKDITAGVIVAIIALPLSIALAIASGVSPEQGLYTAIIAGFFISLLGGSRVLIGGPSGTFLVVVYGIMIQYKLDGLIIATVMSGIILILFGLFKLGSIIKYIPYPITTGFTSGVAVIILSSQIKDFFGLSIQDVPADFLNKWKSFFLHFQTINYQAFFIGFVALLIIILWPKVNHKIPGNLIAIFVTTIITQLFKLDVNTIGSQFGNLSTSLPSLRFPHFDSINEFFNVTKQLIEPAFTIAIICAIESLLSAVVSDGMLGTKHNSNMELIGQGSANIASGLFGGIPATGALARTVANIKNGGRTPIAGIVHAFILLIILVSLMPLVQLIPMSSLAAVLFMVSYNMSGWREFKNLFRAPKSDIFILLVTFFITIFIDVVRAIEIGMIFASLLFMKRMSDVSNIKSNLDYTEDNAIDTSLTNIPKDILVYEINGPFFFGAADKFMEAVNKVSNPAKVILVKMERVPAIDATALHAFKTFLNICKNNHTLVLVSGLNPQPKYVIKKSKVIDIIGKDHLFEQTDTAINYAKKLIE